jgi:hypothetical protein
MRTAGRTACAALAVLMVALPVAPALAAADPVTGYWSRTQVGAPVPVEPPTPAPEGGSWVAGDPSGQLAVTAVRAEADPGGVVAGLQLPVADAVGAPAVLVCPTTETWVAQQNGRLEAAPLADCSSPVPARVEQDLLLIDLPPALRADTVDLLLTPVEGSSFSLTLERATAEAVVQVPEPATAPPAAPLPPPTGPTVPDTGFSGGTALPALLPAPLGEPLLAAPGLPEPAAAAVPQPQAAPPALAPTTAAPRALTEPDRTASLLAVAVLAALAVLALRLAGQPAAAPRHLGGGARLSRPVEAAPVAVPTGDRGVGRFRAPRLRPPVRI